MGGIVNCCGCMRLSGDIGRYLVWLNFVIGIVLIRVESLNITGSHMLLGYGAFKNLRVIIGSAEAGLILSIHREMF